ncbi:MAG TPA: hypothetical protein VEM34_11200 [Burkholderiales bacterium]|nr:hypothetical protein [Burkholderiales bacterium]
MALGSLLILIHRQAILPENKKAFGIARRRLGAMLLAVSLLPGWDAVAADSGLDSGASVNVNGSARAGWWSKSRSLDQESDIGTGALWAKAQLDLGAAGGANIDGWVGDQSHGNSISNRRNRYERLRELYWQKSAGDVDLRLGPQIIVWGRADAIKPTDNLTPRDFTLLTPEDSDQRFGTFATSATYHFGEYSVQTVWLPTFQTSVIPLRPVSMVSYRYDSPPRRNQLAFKFDYAGHELDWSLSYFDGYDTIPDLAPVGAGPGGLTVGLTNHHLQVWGADASWSVGRYALRGEVASMRPDAEEAGAFEHKHPQTWLVIGGERGFGEHLNVDLQYFAQKVMGFSSPDNLADPIARQVAWQQAAIANQIAGFQQGFTLRLAWNWASDSWHAETSTIFSVTNSARLWRGRLVHAPDDHWRINFGFDRYSGPDHSLFGELKDNSTLFSELRYVF